MTTVFTTMIVCVSIVSMAFIVLLALPQSKLRSVFMELFQYVLAAGLVLLVLSPIDPIPDVIFPVGFLDDLGYIVGAFASIRAAQEQRHDRELMS